MLTTERTNPKRVVYLWGAGATQAEAQYLGAPISLLMRDTNQFGEGIATRILRRLGRKVTSSFGPTQGIDIEKVISLLASTGIEDHSRLADDMRANYFKELKSSLAIADVLNQPKLAVDVLRMHKDPVFADKAEILSGIITTNHDGLLQVASQLVFGNINVGFQFSSSSFTERNSNSIPPILQLHGSFTWQFGRPLKVTKLQRNAKYIDTVWIPPTILKESKNYPFNKLAGLAYELLAHHCDVLRVIGASLTQNDWNILSLIFNAQRHNEYTNGAPFPIELIMPHNSGEDVKNNCACLKGMNTIGHLTEGHFAAYKDPTIDKRPGTENPFAYWLNEKKEYHIARGELERTD